MNTSLLQRFFFLFIISSALSCRLFKPHHDDPDWSEYNYYDDDSLKYGGEDILAQDLYDNQPLQSAYEIKADLIHTKLDVQFDWDRQRMYGKEWVSLKAHFYPIDSVVLDARGMFIHKVELVQKDASLPLKFSYSDSLHLNIQLGRIYTAAEPFTLFIEYTARPEEIGDTEGSAAISKNKGLYFINPKNEDPDTPRQLWTQGETQSNSVWIPTIDKPNMKTTLELSMTIDSSMKTLSNGLMVSSKLNANGTRTDTWKLDKPFAPYLIMMAAGHFNITRDKWRNIEVNYYLDPEYAPYARRIFGNTPEMIEFYSKIFGYEYVWPKYSQVVVHDFVSGAMENVTATVHYDALNQTSREMIDENHEDIIAHELSHHWFGDLVTCKSWSQIPLNESFATYAEYLWIKHKYGVFDADEHAEADLEQYMSESEVKQMPLIRYRYWDREDLFDANTYQKGGYILRMLHQLVGDEAFTQALSLYLNTYQFKTVEVDQLRISFETVTGRDLKWFFDQWFLRPGHPNLNISQEYSEPNKSLSVIMSQTASYSSISNNPAYSEPYVLPLDIDIYTATGIIRKQIIFNTSDTTLNFTLDSEPLLVNVDAEKKLLCTKQDTKSKSQFIYQFRNAPLYKDKMEALQEFYYHNNDDLDYANMLVEALKSKYYQVREKALSYIEVTENNYQQLLPILQSLALTDSSSLVRAAAVTKLNNYDAKDVLSTIKQCLKDSSYEVLSTALGTLHNLDSTLALQEAKRLSKDSNYKLSTSVMFVFSESRDTSVAPLFASKVNNTKGIAKFSALLYYARYLFSIGYPYDENLLNPLYISAENNLDWMVRFAAASSLIHLRSALQELQSTQSELLNTLKKQSPEYQSAQSKIDVLQNRIDSMTKRFQDLQSRETNDVIKNIYGN